VVKNSDTMLSRFDTIPDGWTDKTLCDSIYLAYA